MTKQYLRQDQASLIKESLLVNISRLKSNVTDSFSDKLYKFEKLSPHEYDSVIQDLKEMDLLYKMIDTKTTIIIIDQLPSDNMQQEEEQNKQND